MMIAFLGVISFFIFIIFGILFIVSLFKRKKGKMKRNALISGVSFLLLIFLVVIDSDDIETIDSSQNDKDNKIEEEQDKKDEEAKAKQDKEEQDRKDEEAKAKQDKEEQDKNDEEAKAKQDKEEQDKNDEDYGRLLFGEFTIGKIKAKIEDDILKFEYKWMNQSGRKTTFVAVGYFEVTQDGEPLEETSDVFNPMNNNLILRQVPDGVTSPVKIEYKINNDKPIKVTFGAFHEIDKTRETIEIKVK